MSRNPLMFWRKTWYFWNDERGERHWYSGGGGGRKNQRCVAWLRAEEVGGEGSLGMRQGTRVASCRPGGGDSGSGWELLAPGDESLGSYDWVVVTSAPTPSGGGILRQTGILIRV